MQPQDIHSDMRFSALGRYEADHVGMILMACSGYDPSHAAKLWHEFDAIYKRQAAYAQFFAPYNAILREKRAALEKKGHKSGLERLILDSMVKDGLLHIYSDNGSSAGETYDSFVYPAYVSSFPLEPSIHPYDGVFTGRLSVEGAACGGMSLASELSARCHVTPCADSPGSCRALSLPVQRRPQVCEIRLTCL
jgi:hypothetical protein